MGSDNENTDERIIPYRPLRDSRHQGNVSGDMEDGVENNLLLRSYRSSAGDEWPNIILTDTATQDGVHDITYHGLATEDAWRTTPRNRRNTLSITYIELRTHIQKRRQL